MTQASAKKSPRKPVSPASKPPAPSSKPPKSALPLKASTAEGTAVKPVRSVQVKRSGVHGKGVFAGRAFAKGETIIEYKGEVITWEEANRRHPHDPKDPNHTFYFHLDDHWVIDGKFNGNAARWINHACDPNCEADEDDGRVFIKARRAIEPGQELFYDYGLVIDERITKKLKKEYACWCGSPKCRGTMLSGRK